MVAPGESSVYTFTGYSFYPNAYWSVDNGTLTFSEWNGSTYTAYVQWNSSGSSGSVSFYAGTSIGGGGGIENGSGGFENGGNQEFPLGTLSVTFYNCQIPSAPLSALSFLNLNCTTVRISRTGLPQTGTGWYWQVTPDGTNTGSAGTTFDVTTAGTFYLRAKSLSGECWSSPISITVSLNLPATPLPSNITLSSNLCGPRTLTRSTPPTGISWFWQGTNPNGTERLSAESNAITYSLNSTGNSTIFLRPYNNSTGCWGAARGTAVAVNNPIDVPIQPIVQVCESQRDVVVTPTGVMHLVEFYSGTTLLASGVSSRTFSNLPLGDHIYNLKHVSNGCTSQNFTPITIKIISGGVCDNSINWVENVGYSPVDGSVISKSRSYLDGEGKTLQSQVLDLETNHVLASQPIYDGDGRAVGSTLPAPINSSTFAYRSRFMTNTSGASYHHNDFTQRNNGPAQLINASAVSNTGIGTLGWYYSNQNTIESNIPTTAYPFSLSWSEPGPDPKLSRSFKAGETFRPGVGKDSKSERIRVTTNEIPHYYNLKNHFVSGSSERVVYFEEAEDHTTWVKNQNVTFTYITQNGQTYTRVTTNVTTGNPGVQKFGGNLTVKPNTGYKLRVRGYRTTSANVSLYVHVPVFPGGTIVSFGASLPSGAANEAWVESFFTTTINGGMGTISIGARWQTTTVIGGSFFVNAVELIEVTSAYANDPLAYKVISTDENGSKSVSYLNTQGNVLATALLDVNNQPYNWAYSYLDNLGRLVAEVAPNGVDINSTAYPKFVTTYKYDYLNNLIETNSTDEGITRYVYTEDGKIRFSQNQLQASSIPPRFSYTNYDHLDRLIESGEYVSNGAGAFIFEPATTVTPAPNSVLLIVENTGFTGISKKLDAIRCLDYSFIDYDVPASDYPSTVGYETQKLVFGDVARTENANSTTWYSYDEFGDLAWQKQRINGVGDKTLEYVYDQLGNLKDVVYQKSQPDAFYHHYTYDKNQRLIEIHTSRDTVNKTLHGTYSYYLHGPLKRFVLGNNLQGIDYVYGINGELKSINGPTKNNDPGLDNNDVFGMSIDYFTGDFSGNGFNPGTNAISGVSDLFNGLPKAIRYHNIVDNNKAQQYAYNYDSRYQLANARFVAGNATSLPSETAFQEQIGGYDKNGNITALKRKNGKNAWEDDFTYVYEPHSNRLDKVTQNSVNYADYTYDAIGQLTKEVKGNQTLNFVYNAYGLVSEIRDNGNQVLQSYHYSDRGDLLRKVFYHGNAPSKQQIYVSDATGNVMAIYEQALPSGTINLIELPVYGSGRIATYKFAQNMYLYEVNDHLGNVRALIGEPETDTFLATMESETQEEPPFQNINSVVNGTANRTINGNEVVRLNSASPVGPAIKLLVTPGDKIDLEAYAYYEGGNGYQNTIAASTLINAIAGAFGGVLNAPGDPGKTYNTISSGINNPNMGLGGAGSSTLPGAYMQYMVYDDLDQFQFGGYTRITEAANFAKEKVTRPTITIEKPGFIYIFLYNASSSTNFVYWDDFKITHQHSPIIAGADYYPFGLSQAGREIKEEKYKYGYQGQYSERDSLTKYNEFELRFYDARIGRFTTVDPYGQFYSGYMAMGNNPMIITDPSGGLAGTPKAFGMWNVSEATHMLAHGIVLQPLTIMPERTLSIGGLDAISLGSAFRRSAYDATADYKRQLAFNKPTSENVAEFGSSHLTQSVSDFADFSIPGWHSSGQASNAFVQGRYLDAFAWEAYGLVEMTGVSLVTNYLSKLTSRLIFANIATKASIPARQVEQYALRAAEDGFYPVMKRGFSNPQELVWLNKGDVWKFGTTKNPLTRYSQSFLDNTGEGLRYTTEFSGTFKQATALERMKILNFGRQNGFLPAGNKIVK